MPTFRFRAEAALTLRRTRDEEAQRALGQARRATRLAESELEREERLLAETLAQAQEEEARASDLARAVWSRNWMRRQRLEIAAAARRLDEQRRAERAAAQQAMEARRKLRALEHLRDRMWRAFLDAERRAEQKDLDMLGGLRYVARRGVPEGA
jgi:flagellar biosynthesis chaperone FliJ